MGGNPGFALGSQCHLSGRVLREFYPVPPVQDLSGKPTEFAPKWSGSLTASYSVLLPADYRFTVELSPYFSSRFFSGGGTDDEFTRIGGYGRVDGRLTLESSERHWAVHHPDELDPVSGSEAGATHRGGSI